MQVLTKPTPVEVARFDSTASALSQDGQSALVGKSNGKLQVLDSQGSERISLSVGTQGVSAVAFNDSSDLVAASSGDAFAVWDLEGQKRGRFIQAGSPPSSLSLSHDGGLLAIGRADGTVELVDVQKGIRTFHDANTSATRITRISVDSTGSRLFALGSDGVVNWWKRDGDDWMPFKVLGLVGSRVTWTASPDGERVAVVKGTTPTIWDSTDWKPITPIGRQSSRSDADPNASNNGLVAFSRMAHVWQSWDVAAISAFSIRIRDFVCNSFRHLPRRQWLLRGHRIAAKWLSLRPDKSRCYGSRQGRNQKGTRARAGRRTAAFPSIRHSTLTGSSLLLDQLRFWMQEDSWSLATTAESAS